MKMRYIDGLKMVISYLRGEQDIYDGKHSDVIRIWDNAWDEMRFLGYDPQTVDGIQNYIAKEL
jgi:hypothetical protein